MSGKKSIKPRKTAAQTRSRNTVNALLEATARILIKEGYDKASTNRIAAVAGVSVGSLYQYFPSKEALVAALIDRHNQEVRSSIQGELSAPAGLPLPRAVRQLVAAAIKAHRVDPQLHRVLAEQIPRVGKLETVAAFNQQYHHVFEAYLKEHQNEIHADDIKLAAFVCVTSIEALTHTAVLHHKMVSDRETQDLLDEATLLIVGYLTRSRL